MFTPGQRIRPTDEFIKGCRSKARTGTVLHRHRYISNVYLVMWDGQVTKTQVHESFLQEVPTNDLQK